MAGTLAPPPQAETPAPPAARAVLGTRPVPYGLLCCGGLLLLAVIAERWLLAHHAFPGDIWAARLGMSHKPWPVWDITRVYQQVGRPLVAIGEVGVILAWLWRHAGRREARGLLIVLLASLTCGVIKILCGPTPLWATLPHHVGTNFPSGVVTFMTATVGYLALVARRLGHRIAPAAVIVAIVGAGPARVVGGQHLISDALGGYMLGGAWLLIAHAYLAAPARRVRQHAPWTMPQALETLE